MKIPNWKASGRQQEKGRKRHRRRQQKAKAFKALVKKLQAPRQSPRDFLWRSGRSHFEVEAFDLLSTMSRRRRVGS
ncbi:MAG: hypothetical protein AAGA40_19460 [Cyanobacteria bacterium P01_E01_bin.45]